MCCTNSFCVSSNSCHVQGAVTSRAPQWTSESSLQDGEDLRHAVAEERAERSPQGWGIITPETEGGWDEGQRRCWETGPPIQHWRPWGDGPRWPPQVCTARHWSLAVHEQTWERTTHPTTSHYNQNPGPDPERCPSPPIFTRLPLMFSSFLCQSPSSMF